MEPTQRQSFALAEAPIDTCKLGSWLLKWDQGLQGKGFPQIAQLGGYLILHTPVDLIFGACLGAYKGGPGGVCDFITCSYLLPKLCGEFGGL